MTDPKPEPYPIASESSAPPPPPDDRAKSADLKAKLNLSGLLEGFEEDADFDKDPELEAKITGKPIGAVSLPSGPPRPEFVVPGFGQPSHWAIVGCVLVVGALVATAVNAPNHTFLRILLTLYTAIVNTGTGMVALYLSARLLEHRFGSIEVAASRMLVCVGLFTLLFHLRISVFGPDWPSLNNSLVVLIAMSAYVLSVAACFKLWDRQKLGFVVGFHAILWMIVQVGMQLASFVDAAPVQTVAPVTPPA